MNDTTPGTDPAAGPAGEPREGGGTEGGPPPSPSGSGTAPLGVEFVRDSLTNSTPRADPPPAGSANASAAGETVRGGATHPALGAGGNGTGSALLAGRRVALLVYNDAHADARVLKTARSLRSAGADVRILAVARTHLGYPATVEDLDDGVTLVRVREPAFISYVPRLKRVLQRTTSAARKRIPTRARPARAPHPTGDPSAESEMRHTAEGTDRATQSPAAAPAGATFPPPRPEPPGTADNSGLRSALNRLLVAVLDPVERVARTVILSHYWAMVVAESRRWRPDVVHANDGNTLAPGRVIARRTGARLVYDSHELWRHRNVRPDRPVARRVEAAIERHVIARTDGVITVSPSIAHWLQRTYRLPTAPTLVRNIPSGGELSRADTGRLRQLAGLAATDQVIAYGGRITTSRGIEETIDALALLPAQVHLVILGYGDAGYLAVLRARIAAAGLTGRVHFVGKVAPHEVAPALADADLAVVFVRPTCLSYEYSLPNKLFESIHAGLPIAAADLPDTREIVERYGVGEIFAMTQRAPDSPPDADARDMAATMSLILQDPARYRAASRAAATELTWQHEEAELLELYRLMLTHG